MAHWKVTVKKGGHVNGLALETGMYVEITTNSNSDPIRYGDGMLAIADAFSEKYGLDARKFRSMNMQYHLDTKKIN